MTSEDDFELMEIPLSPTNYEQPSTPDHEPPSALEAEKAITEVLDNLRSVRNTFFVHYGRISDLNRLLDNLKNAGCAMKD